MRLFYHPTLFFQNEFFRCGNLKIYYNEFTERVNFESNTDWVSLHPAYLEIVFTLMHSKVSLKITIKEYKVEIDLMKYNFGFGLTMISHKYASTVVIPEKILKILLENSQTIMNLMQNLI